MPKLVTCSNQGLLHDCEIFGNLRCQLYSKVIKPQHFARFSDLWYSLPLGLCLIVIRFIVEKMLVKPIGCSLGLSDKPRRQPKENKVLESYFKSKSKLSTRDASSLSRQCGLSEIQVSSWYILNDNFNYFYSAIPHHFKLQKKLVVFMLSFPKYTI